MLWLGGSKVVCCVAGSTCCAPAVVPLFCSITVMPRDESGRPITECIVEPPCYEGTYHKHQKTQNSAMHCNVDPLLL